MSSQSLWADLGEVEKVRTPRTILLEQAEFLTQATEGSLVAGVDNLTLPGRDFRYELNVSVPVLNHYKLAILSVRHNIDLYPIQVQAERPSVDRSCVDEAAFLETLRAILSSSDVRRLLSRLLAQVT